MRRHLKSVISILALCVAFSCVNLVSAQIRTGGYKEISTDDAEVEAAAKFAVEAEGRKQDASYTLVSIEHAESQVVAGINYRLCLKVSESADSDPKEVQTVVYKNLKREYSLTSWEDKECGEKDSEGNHATSIKFYQLKSDDMLHTPAVGSAERKAILDAVREDYKGGDDHPSDFKVNYLKVHKGWAWINVTPLDASGQPVADPAPLLFHNEQGKWVDKDLNDVGLEGDEHDGPHDPSPKYIKALEKKYPGVPLDIIPKEHKGE
ncbi:MAG TPA: cystatin domain-containing protein [Pyrinomonadaceae bacterium]|nr:cystatin domain-containing protein [Pyrinomonadaceae bacterium]